MDEATDSLARLEREERTVSQQRQRLHDRIDFARASAFGDVVALERLTRLEAEERELSRRRLDLTARIDAIRTRHKPRSSG